MPITSAHPIANKVGKTLDTFSLERLLGYGSCGAVYLGVAPGINAAVKLIETQKSFNEEVAALRIFQNIDGVPEMMARGKLDGFNGIVMTLGHANLFQLKALNSGATFTDETVQKLMLQCTMILEKVHSMGIVHRDIKSDNWMITSPEGPHNKVKLMLSDFGLAYKYRDANGKICRPSDKYNLAKRDHATPNDMMKELHTPVDDMAQLGYMAIEMKIGNLACFKKDGDICQMKLNMMRMPELFLPDPVKFLGSYFRLVGQHHGTTKVKYGMMLEAIKGSIANSEPESDIILADDNGVLKLL